MTNHEAGAVRVARYQTPSGPGWIEYSDNGISEIVLPGLDPPAPVEPVPTPDVAGLAEQLTAYFSGGPWPEHPELVARAGSTPFTRSVYEAVAAIPAGRIRTYGDIARQLGRPGAARAVGRAMATNPFPVVIPCHRVVGSSGSLTGFAGGIEMKASMLEMEGVNG
jgi:methylated-DNA-[protein]-cysteine S-methyltransferase